MERPKLRLKGDVWEQNLLPNGKYGYGDKWTFGVKDKRRTAIERVVTTLPENYFARFKEAMEDGAWFVPWNGLWGKAAEIPHKRVILYLSPTLEFAEDWVVE